MSLVNRGEDLVTENSSQINSENANSGKKSDYFGKLKIIFAVLVLLVAASFFLYDFYRNSTTILVDNPTSTGITFKIGDKEVNKLDAFSHKKIELSPGKYELTVNGKKVGSFEKKYTDFKGFLNPTNDIYLQEYIVYGNEKGYDKLPNNKIEAYGNKAEGPFKKYEGIYIVGDWDYSIDQELPEEVTISKYNITGYTIKTKLYRYDEFVDLYNKYYASEGGNSTSSGTVSETKDTKESK